MGSIIQFVKEPYAGQLQRLAKVVIGEEMHSAKLAAQEAIRILNFLRQNTLCEGERQMLLRLIATFCVASHPNRQSFECDQMRIRLDISQG